jgi:benzoate-CoA ligase family protein
MVWQAPASLNIADYFLFDRLREGQGDRVAIRTDSSSLTYREVGALTNGLRKRIKAEGVVAPEDRVLIALPDGPEFAASIFGILAAGAVAVMINPELRPDHLGAILDSIRAPLAVVAPEYRQVLEAAMTNSRQQPRLLEITAGGVEPAEPLRESYPSGPDSPAIWLFSGGTTGVPKIVVQRHGSFANTTELYAKATLGYQSDDITISVPRLYFGYATGSNLFFPFSVGASTVLFPEKPTPETVLEKIKQHRPTILISAPSAINAMASLPGVGRSDLESLRFATSAGEPLPDTVYHRWIDRFGVEILDGLGTAEMWHIFVTNRLGDVRAGTVGRVVDGFSIHSRDDAGSDVAVDEVGRMWVSGDSLGLGYWELPDQTREAFRDGWFVSSDLISIDANGYVTHRGRADDAIKVKGKWFRPQELESCLLEHGAVKECAVVAVEDNDGLLKPIAFVVAAKPVSEEELQNHVLKRLEPYKHPRRVVFMDELPLTHLGKVDRGKLKHLV